MYKFRLTLKSYKKLKFKLNYICSIIIDNFFYLVRCLFLYLFLNNYNIIYN